MILVRYRLTDGLIDGTYSANTEDLLTAQIVPDDPTYGYLMSDTELGAQELAERYAVVDGALQAKALIIIVADPLQFQADGIDACLISVEPIIACTLRVNGVARALTMADPILELTSDSPQTFVVRLEPMATHWAEPLTLEAI